MIIGGGPTGVEMAGAVAEVARHRCAASSAISTRARPASFSSKAATACCRPLRRGCRRGPAAQLEQLGVIVRLNTLVTDVRGQGVTLRGGDRMEQIDAATLVWAAGVRASPLGKVLADAAGIQADRQGRVPVQGDLSLPGHPEVFVIGDLASARAEPDGPPLPGLAPVAMQQGHYVAKLIRGRLRGRTQPPFRYWDRGTMATIGRARAVAMVGPLKFSGLLAWLAWLFIHLMYIVEFENRLLIFFQWAWNYLTWNRSARLITGARRQTHDRQHDDEQTPPAE